MKSLSFHKTIVKCSHAAIYALPLLLAATAVYASGGGEGEEGAAWKSFAWQLLDTVVLVGFLYWFLASKIRDFFSGRRTDIKVALEEAQRAKEEADKKFKEYETKLTKATDEITGVVEMIKSQGLVERDKILDDARKAAEKMKEDTKTRMDQELSNASIQLREEAVQLSVQMAEEILKRTITPADHENMVKDYLDKVVIKH